MELLSNVTAKQVNIDIEDKKRLLLAITLSTQCQPIKDAFSVGAMVFDASGNLAASGFSRETGTRSHAEEVALLRAKKDQINVSGGTLYSSLEPCGERSSSNKTCTERIVEAGIKKVVFAMREPVLFVNPAPLERFAKHGIELVQITELASFVRAINRHLFDA